MKFFLFSHRIFGCEIHAPNKSRPSEEVEIVNEITSDRFDSEHGI